MSSASLPIPCIEGDKGIVNIGIGATFLAICIISTCLRIFTRMRRVTAGLGMDDAFILMALALAIMLFVVTNVHVHYGLGRHIGCLSPTQIVTADKVQAIGEIPVMASTAFSRISICLFLIRIFSVNTSWRWTLYIIIALTAATNIACGTAILLQCHPRAKMWDPAIPGTCWSPLIEVAIGQIQGAVSAFLDLVLSGLPVYCMWKIQMSRRNKTAICGIMSLGVFAACCVLVRIIVLGKISGEDITWDSALPSLMGDLESYVTIIAANIATLRPLFTHRFKKSAGTGKHSSESKTRLRYIKFPTNSNDLDRWPGFGTTGTSYDSKATAGRVCDNEVSLEHMDGIKRVVDVDVSV